MDDEVLERLPAAFVSFGDDGLIRWANRTLGALIQQPREALIGKHIESLLTVPSRIFYQTHVFPLLKMRGRIDEVYLTARISTGEEVALMINGRRFEPDDGPVQNECVLMPMSRRDDYENQILEARRQAEQANQEKERVNESLMMTQQVLNRQQEVLKDRNCQLETLRESLADQVAQRTAELTKVVEDLQGFNYSIAHDLRAPMRAILSTSAILLSEHSEFLSEEQRLLLERQAHNGRRLVQLVEDLLSFSRLGLSPLEKGHVDLSAMATAAAQAALAHHDSTNITLKIQPGVDADGDPTMIQIVLDNLFDNAVKYSPSGGEVGFGATDYCGGRAFFVQDMGIGIDPKYAQKIFKPFERLHREEEFPGTGIGLANVKRIIEKHGGQVWFESSPGRGSTFFFTL